MTLIPSIIVFRKELVSMCLIFQHYGVDTSYAYQELAEHHLDMRDVDWSLAENQRCWENLFKEGWNRAVDIYEATNVVTVLDGLFNANCQPHWDSDNPDDIQGSYYIERVLSAYVEGNQARLQNSNLPPPVASRNPRDTVVDKIKPKLTNKEQRWVRADVAKIIAETGIIPNIGAASSSSNAQNHPVLRNIGSQHFLRRGSDSAYDLPALDFGNSSSSAAAGHKLPAMEPPVSGLKPAGPSVFERRHVPRHRIQFFPETVDIVKFISLPRIHRGRTASRALGQADYARMNAPEFQYRGDRRMEHEQMMEDRRNPRPYPPPRGRGSGRGDHGGGW
ncbi:hypothetical protein K402DRAFT_84337 [Aulographum hederae CBS 113979]|uniref:Uncharacterized protein n=1 Tax=Aulographum hederae CBS 113979 TaxID=1176131 RepID=A0A6G1H0P6_9PEZI|nr:hypothetical protein K402DRAFT_84337 [Aulographum hederae CBS 113979]